MHSVHTVFPLISQTVTHYGLDGLEFEVALRPSQPPVQWVPDLFPSGTEGGTWH